MNSAVAGKKKPLSAHWMRFGGSSAVAQEKDGSELAFQGPIPVALSGKIIKIFLRIATIPILFLCRSLRTAHRIQKTCVLFFAVLPRLLFRVRIHTLPEDISDSLRRALADATPSLTTLNLYLFHHLHTVEKRRNKECIREDPCQR